MFGENNHDQALYKESFNNFSDQKNNGGSSFAGLVRAERYGMPERTFKRWLSTSLFRKITHGFYEKRYH